MEKYGKVLSTKISKNGYGYVQFASKDEAEKAID